VVTSTRRAKRGDALEVTIESALEPGRFITYRAGWDFPLALEEVAAQIRKLVAQDPERAIRLYETFLAGCYEKAGELDDSSGNFGMFIDGLYRGWIKARQAAAADPDETATWLLARMDDDPYGFAYQLERDAAKVMNRANLAAFARQVRRRFDGEPAGGAELGRPGVSPGRKRWAGVLRAIYVARRDVAAYVALAEETELSAQDCLAVAALLRGRRPEQALGWAERGLAFGKGQRHESTARYHLAKLKRELLTKLGRGSEAIEEAWVQYREQPSKFTYEELMRFVPKAKRAAWHGKAMEAASGADLGSLIELMLETKEIDRLVGLLRAASDADLEGLSHYTTAPAATRLAKSHPDVAAKVFRALGMRILRAKKSKYYDAAVENFEAAKACYERAGLARPWAALVAEVRDTHRRKVGFMAAFERLVAGQGPSDEPSFLERAKSRWFSR